MSRAFVPHVISRDSALGGYLDIERSLRVDQGTSNVSDGSFYSRTFANGNKRTFTISCLLYTSPSPRDRTRSRMPSSA